MVDDGLGNGMLTCPICRMLAWKVNIAWMILPRLMLLSLTVGIRVVSARRTFPGREDIPAWYEWPRPSRQVPIAGRIYPQLISCLPRCRCVVDLSVGARS